MTNVLKLPDSTAERASVAEHVRAIAAELAGDIAITLAATQRSADTISEAANKAALWHFADHYRQYHLLSTRLSAAEDLVNSLKDSPLDGAYLACAVELLGQIERAEYVLVGGCEPWLYVRRRKKFKESALGVLADHAHFLRAAFLKAQALASGEVSPEPGAGPDHPAGAA